VSLRARFHLKPDREQDLSPGSGRGMHKQVLVALLDGDPDIAEMYALGLSMRGFRVKTCGSGAELFAAANAELPDIFVIDWDLPAGGEAILIAVRRDDRMSAIPVLILTGLTQSDDVIERGHGYAVSGWHVKIHTPPNALADAVVAACA